MVGIEFLVTLGYYVHSNNCGHIKPGSSADYMLPWAGIIPISTGPRAK